MTVAPKSEAWDLYVEDVAGTDEPIVFLHGLGASHHYWPASFRHLAPARRLMFVDLLGFGRSPKPELNYDLDVHLEALEHTRLHRSLGVKCVSLGALLALAFATRHRDRVRVAGLSLSGHCSATHRITERDGAHDGGRFVDGEDHVLRPLRSASSRAAGGAGASP